MTDVEAFSFSHVQIRTVNKDSKTFGKFAFAVLSKLLGAIIILFINLAQYHLDIHLNKKISASPLYLFYFKDTPTFLRAPFLCCISLTLLHSEWPKLYQVLAIRSAIGLMKKT